MNLRLSLQDVSILSHSCGPPNPLQHINVLLELGMPELDVYSTSRCKIAKYRIESNPSFPNCIVFYAPNRLTNPFGHEVAMGISIVTVQSLLIMLMSSLKALLSKIETCIL